MKRIAVILFSLTLVYGGVAWALERCVSHDDQHEHAIEHGDSHSHNAPIGNNPQDSSLPIIHCPYSEIHIGPAAQSGSAQFARESKVTTTHTTLLEVVGSPTFKNTLWLDAVFRGSSTSSTRNGLGLHLLFSVLQI